MYHLRHPGGFTIEAFLREIADSKRLRRPKLLERPPLDSTAIGRRDPCRPPKKNCSARHLVDIFVRKRVSKLVFADLAARLTPLAGIHRPR